MPTIANPKLKPSKYKSQDANSKVHLARPIAGAIKSAKGFAYFCRDLGFCCAFKICFRFSGVNYLRKHFNIYNVRTEPELIALSRHPVETSVAAVVTVPVFP